MSVRLPTTAAGNKRRKLNGFVEVGIATTREETLARGFLALRCTARHWKATHGWIELRICFTQTCRAASNGSGLDSPLVVGSSAAG